MKKKMRDYKNELNVNKKIERKKDGSERIDGTVVEKNCYCCQSKVFAKKILIYMRMHDENLFVNFLYKICMGLGLG